MSALSGAATLVTGLVLFVIVFAILVRLTREDRPRPHRPLHRARKTARGICRDVIVWLREDGTRREVRR